MSFIGNQIDEYIEWCYKATDVDSYVEWCSRVYSFLERAVDAKTANEFNSLTNLGFLERSRSSQVGMLEGLATLARMARDGESGITAATRVNRTSEPQQHAKRVFVVHGHDTEAKESVSRFINRLGVEAIVLHEQPNSGRTVIEKFEVYADVGFAVILLTPDDVGASKNTPTNFKGRARQNVILELGYFLGKLSRRRVCALYKSDVEIPSDYQGVLYVELDSAGIWRTKLAQELVEAGFSIKLEELLKL